MAVAATAIKEIYKGLNSEQIKTFQAVVGVTAAFDTVTVTLPTGWSGTGFTLVKARLEEFATAAAGARTKTEIPISEVSYVEATGVISLVLGATGVATNGRAIIEIAPASLEVLNAYRRRYYDR